MLDRLRLLPTVILCASLLLVLPMSLAKTLEALKRPGQLALYGIKNALAAGVRFTGNIDTARGLLKNQFDFYPVVSISALSAWCIGDIDELEALLPPESGLLTHIGKRARIGHGRIRSIRIEHAEEATDKWRLRVLPWQESPNYLPIQAAFRPPYWAAENRGMAFVPTEL